MGNKAPKNIFCQTDTYTIATEDGGRDLSLEVFLSKIEGEFIKVRKDTFSQRLPINRYVRLVLCSFVAAMYSRTPAYEQKIATQWQVVLDLTDKMQEEYSRASSKQKRRMVKVLSGGVSFNEEDYLTIQEVEELRNSPLQNTLGLAVPILARELEKVPFSILETEDKVGFITSDNPCAWIDPAIYQKPRPFGAGGLVSPTIEITFPISPTQMVLFSKTFPWPNYYVDIRGLPLNELNKRTCMNSNEKIVVRKNELRASWFSF